jgi:hypothetical protein
MPAPIRTISGLRCRGDNGHVRLFIVLCADEYLIDIEFGSPKLSRPAKRNSFLAEFVSAGLTV